MRMITTGSDSGGGKGIAVINVRYTADAPDLPMLGFAVCKLQGGLRPLNERLKISQVAKIQYKSSAEPSVLSVSIRQCRADAIANSCCRPFTTWRSFHAKVVMVLGI